MNELLEIATTLGRREAGFKRRKGHYLVAKRPPCYRIRRTGSGDSLRTGPHPTAYLNQFGEGPLTKRMVQEMLLLNWRAASSIAQGFAEIAAVQSKSQKAQAEDLLRAMLDYRNSGININYSGRRPF